ncbi:hypothetical protein D3C80_1065870 [compost metagenome]
MAVADVLVRVAIEALSGLLRVDADIVKAEAVCQLPRDTVPEQLQSVLCAGGLECPAQGLPVLITHFEPLLQRLAVQLEPQGRRQQIVVMAFDAQGHPVCFSGFESCQRFVQESAGVVKTDKVVPVIAIDDQFAAVRTSFPTIPRILGNFETGVLDKQSHTPCLRGGACRSTGLGAFEHRQGVLTTDKNTRYPSYSWQQWGGWAAPS